MPHRLEDLLASWSPSAATGQQQQVIWMPLGCKQWHQLTECGKFKAMTVNERWRVVKAHDRCIFCFGKHHLPTCTRAVECPYPGCGRNHNQMLHREQESPQPGTSASTVPSDNSGGTANSLHIGVTRHAPKHTVFKVLPVTVKNGDRQIKTYALMDTGSSMSIIRTGLARRLGLSGPPKGDGSDVGNERTIPHEI